MAKSFCIKTNNINIINSLLKNFENIHLENIYLSKNQFKIYNNVIIHYTGKEDAIFFDYLSDILTDVIIEYYEFKILNNIINYNYFYFNDFEKKQILENCISIIDSNENIEIATRKFIISTQVLKFAIDNKSMILDGFVNFRLKDYVKILDELVDLSVNSFLIDREYNEFINLLKIYINQSSNSNTCIHLIYSNNDSLLLDDDFNIINIDENLLNAKYLSDISFSYNDYILNTLLTILPKKLIIHLQNEEDEFINTLKQIFGSRISTCNSCSLCKKTDSYKYLNKIKNKE